jgi:hypothetical protein
MMQFCVIYINLMTRITISTLSPDFLEMNPNLPLFLNYVEIQDLGITDSLKFY